jgi:hypothetical protein
MSFGPALPILLVLLPLNGECALAPECHGTNEQGGSTIKVAWVCPFTASHVLNGDIPEEPQLWALSPQMQAVLAKLLRGKLVQLLLQVLVQCVQCSCIDLAESMRPCTQPGGCRFFCRLAVEATFFTVRKLCV